MPALTWLRAHWRPIAVGLALLLAFASGRWSVHPTPRVEARETQAAKAQEAAHVEQVAKAETHADTAAVASASLAAHHRVHRTRTVHTLPSGERTATTETTVDDGLTLETAQEVVIRLETASLVLGAIDVSREVEARREVEVVQTPAAPLSWSLTALGGLSTDGLVYGAQVGRRLVGPIWLRAQLTGGATWQGLAGVGVEW